MNPPTVQPYRAEPRAAESHPWRHPKSGCLSNKIEPRSLSLGGLFQGLLRQLWVQPYRAVQLGGPYSWGVNPSREHRRSNLAQYEYWWAATLYLT